MSGLTRRSVLAALLSAAALPPAAWAQAPVAAATNINVDEDRMYRDRGYFLNTMQSLNEQERQGVINKMMQRDPGALAEMVYAEGNTNVLYENEFDRAMPYGREMFVNRFKNDIETMNGDYTGSRFSPVANFRSIRFYDLISLGWPKYATSTFSGVYDRMMARMSREGTSFSSLLSWPGRAEGLGNFIKAVTVFEKTNSFLSRLSQSEQTQVVELIFDQIDASTDRGFVHALARVLDVLPANHPAHRIADARIAEGFRLARGPQKTAYGVLASWYAQKGVRLSAATSQIAHDPLYRLERPSRTSAELFDGQGRNFQIHAFFADDDGVSAYNSFVSRKVGDGWSRSRPANGVTLLEKRANGRTIKAYLSEPSAHGAAISVIQDLIAEQGGQETVFVQRGHSQYVNDTAPYLGNIKVGVFGACGLSLALEQGLTLFPNMEITGSSDVGRAVVNNRLVDNIDAQLLSKGYIDWAQTDRYLHHDLASMGGREYFTPYSSIIHMFVKTTQRIENGAPASAPSYSPSAPEPN